MAAAAGESAASVIDIGDTNGDEVDDELRLEQASVSQQPPQKRAKKDSTSQASSVWKWFEKREVQGQMVAFCTISGCKKKDGYKCGSTTSPLHKHVQEKQTEVLHDEKDITHAGTRRMEKWAVAAPSFEKEAIKWLVLHNMPLNTFDDEYFRSMCHALSPKVRIPNRWVSKNAKVYFKLQISYH